MSAAVLYDMHDMSQIARVIVEDGVAVVESGEVPDDVLEKAVVDGAGLLTPAHGDMWLQAWAESFDGVIAGMYEPG